MLTFAAISLSGTLSACAADPVRPVEAASLEGVVGAASTVVSPCDNTSQRNRLRTSRVLSVQVSATPATANVGESVALTATALMSDRSTVTLDPSLIRVSDIAVLGRGDGGFLALTPGTADVLVRCGTISGTTQVVVLSPVQPDSGSLVTALAVFRFDGAAGSTDISNGIPLIPGKVRSQDVPNLRLYVRGAEVPARITALYGRHSDSTLRAVQVQFRTVVADGDSVPASLRLVPSRAATSFAVVPTSMAPAAAALPTDPGYLRQTLVAGRLPAYPLTGADPILVEHDNDFFIAHEIDWTKCGALWNCGRASSYDRPLMMYEAWVRTGDPKYYRRASLTVKSYIDAYVAPNESAVPPWQAFTTSIAINYLVTGDSLARVQVRRLAETLAFQVRDVPAWLQGMKYPDVDPRTKTKAFMAVTDAFIVGAGNPIVGSNTSLGVTVTPTLIDKYLDDLKTAQYQSGCFCTVGFGNGQMNYMAGLLMQNLIRYNEVYKADARIEPLVKAAADYTWANEWLPASGAFKYASVEAVYNGNGMGPVPAPDLNGFLAPAYAWLSRKYGAAYKAQYVAIITGLQTQRNLWMAGVYGKQFDEGFLGYMQSLAWSGVP